MAHQQAIYQSTTVALNSRPRVRRAGNLRGGQSDYLERTALNEMWTEDFEKSLVFWLNGFIIELNKNCYHRCNTTQVRTTKGMGIQCNEPVTETCMRSNTRADSYMTAIYT